MPHPVVILCLKEVWTTNCLASIFPQAGVVSGMNDIASRFMAATEGREEIITEAEAAAEEVEDPQ